jgi:hypothetical protein
LTIASQAKTKTDQDFYKAEATVYAAVWKACCHADFLSAANAETVYAGMLLYNL